MDRIGGEGALACRLIEQGGNGAIGGLPLAITVGAGIPCDHDSTAGAIFGFLRVSELLTPLSNCRITRGPQHDSRRHYYVLTQMGGRGSCADRHKNLTHCKSRENFPGECPERQRGRTVNPLAKPSLVRVQPPPPVFARSAGFGWQASANWSNARSGRRLPRRSAKARRRAGESEKEGVEQAGVAQW